MVARVRVSSNAGPSDAGESPAPASASTSFAAPASASTSFISLAEVDVATDVEMDQALTTPPPSSRRRITPRLSRRSGTRTSRGSSSSAAETPLSPPSLASHASRVRRALTSPRVRRSGRDSPYSDVEHDDSGSDDEREERFSEDHKESPLSRTQMRDRRLIKDKVRSMKEAFARGVRGVGTRRYPRGDLLDVTRCFGQIDFSDLRTQSLYAEIEDDDDDDSEDGDEENEDGDDDEDDDDAEEDSKVFGHTRFAVAPSGVTVADVLVALEHHWKLQRPGGFFSICGGMRTEVQ